MVVEGVDYSFARPQPQALANAGKKFAVRYGGMGTTNKFLTVAEKNALNAVGIDIVANVEGSAGGYMGTAAGQQWAAAGDSYFRSVGMPAGRPIYFSVDFDAGASDWPAIDAALRGSASVIGKDRVGVYGSYDVVEHCRTAGVATWFWQCYAWSNGRWSSAAHMQQYKNGVTIGGGDCDLTRAMKDDFGQWEYDVPLTASEIQAIANAVWAAPLGVPTYPNRGAGTALKDLSVLRDALVDPATNVPRPGTNTPLGKALGQVNTLAGTPAPVPDVDEIALAAALAPLLNGITESEIANALRTVLRSV